MKINLSNRRQLLAGFAIIAVTVLVVYGLSSWWSVAETKPAPLLHPVVEVQTMTPQTLAIKVESQGVVQPATETVLVSEVTGVVSEVSSQFTIGGLFKKGDTLARIEDSDYQAALREAKAELAANKARLAEEQAKGEAERRQWRQSGRPISKAPPLLLRTPYIEEAKARVEAAQARFEQASHDLQRTEISAPYDGMVREKLINPGQYLSTGTQIGTIMSTDRAEVRLPIKPADLEYLDLPAVGRPNNELTVTLSQVSNGNKEWQAVVSRTEGVVDEGSRMHYIVATLEDPYRLGLIGEADSSAGEVSEGGILTSDAPEQIISEEPPPENKSTASGTASLFSFRRSAPQTAEQDTLLTTPTNTGPALKIGTFVSAAIAGRRFNNAYRIPNSALYGDGQVLIVNNGAVEFRKIVPLHTDENGIIVKEGIHPGEQVVVSALSNPLSGMKVRIKQSSETIQPASNSGS